MKEITKLNITRQQLSEKYFYYNGCTDTSAEDKQAEDTILNLAADVLIQILKADSDEKGD